MTTIELPPSHRPMTTPEPESTREIPRDLLQEILLKLPTRDVARFCCVSRLWRDSAMDPSFRSLHGKARHVICGAAEALLISEKRKNDCNDEAGIFNLSSGKALCRVAIIGDYVLANVCNGFLCFMHGDRGRSGLEAPVLVCNPATGETLQLPGAPRLPGKNRTHLFALGYSPPTNEYKLFRLSSDVHIDVRVDVDVYTLGGSSTGGWRNRWYSSRCRLAGVWAPVLIDGKLYVPTVPPRYNHYTDPGLIPDKILVIDVSTETCDTYSLPSYYTYCRDDRPPVSAFELSGRLCFASHNISTRWCPEAVNFWVLSLSPPSREGKPGYDIYGDEVCWEWEWDQRYSFHMEKYDSSGLPGAGWLSDNGMLCYMEGSTLHMYDTRGQRSLAPNGDDILRWEQQVDLPTTPLLPGCRWPNIYGGYRPTLLSPLTLQPQDDVNDGNRYQLEQSIFSTLYDAISKPNTSPRLIDRTK